MSEAKGGGGNRGIVSHVKPALVCFLVLCEMKCPVENRLAEILAFLE
jgi:hypothetical protein